MPIADPTDPKDIYVDDLQRRLEATKAKTERLALMLCPPLPKGWSSAEPDAEELVAIHGPDGQRAFVNTDGELACVLIYDTVPTPREAASYLLGMLLRQEGAVE